MSRRFTSPLPRAMLSALLLSLAATLSAAAPPAAPPASAPPATASAPAWRFTFTLAEPATTSAGVFDAGGRLVRVLWTLRPLAAGEQSGAWDGLDAFGKEADPAGRYSIRVAANRGSYLNVGAIGNSGQPPSAFGHTPANIESVAVDKDGNIYTANGWDEAGADFKKWDKDGHSVYDAKFAIRNGKPNGAPYAIAVDEQYLYCSVGGWEHAPWNHRQQIQRFRLADGKPAPFTGKDVKDGGTLMDGHIQVYEWPKKLIPEGTPKDEAELMAAPLRALTVHGDTICVADALGGKIRKYHKETGAAQGDFAVKLPRAIAADDQGRLWVGHGNYDLTLYQADGAVARQAPAFICHDEAIAVGPRGQVYAADSYAGGVKMLDPNQPDPIIRRVVSPHYAKTGARAADYFFHLKGVAVDREGNIITIQKDPPGGARLAKFTSKGKLLWETLGLEFVSLGNYGAADPDAFYSMSLKRYRLLDRAKGTWEYTGNPNPYAQHRVPSAGGPTPYRSDPHGVVRVLRLGEKDGAKDFVFLPVGDGVQAWEAYAVRDKEGERHVLRLVALVGGRDPEPDGSRPGHNSAAKPAGLGQWTWTAGEEAEEGTVDPEWIAEHVEWFKKPGEGKYSCFGMDVDATGNIIFANTSTHSVWEIPLMKLNNAGYPVYDWASAREIVPRDASPLGFEPNMAQRAGDGSVYAFGWSKPWPQPKNNPFWMGGSTLARFSADGKLLWAVPLKETVVGLDVIPADADGGGKGGVGGCMVGVGKAAEILHYSPDGLLIGSMKPGAAMSGETGWMDNHASVAVNRDPRDGLLDVFAEDDYVCRIGWYRVDDRRVEVIAGEVKRDRAAR